MLQLVIFDMDGVLVDSEPAITAAAIEALSEWGIAAERADFKPFTGMGDDLFIGGVARLHGGEYEVRMKERAYEIYLNRTDRVGVYPASAPLVRALRCKNLKTAVASASDHIKVCANIRCIGLDPEADFDAVITGSDVARKKPFPDIFLKAAEAVAISPSDAIVIEDALSGVQAAKAAGAYCIAVTTSFPADALREAGADAVIYDLSEAEQVIEAALATNLI